MSSDENLYNSLSPDQARQLVGPDLVPNCLTLMAFRKESFEKKDFFFFKSADDKNDEEIQHAKK